MAGSINNPQQELPIVFKRTVGSPLDAWQEIANLDNLSADIPESVRFPGMLFWVQDATGSGFTIPSGSTGWYFYFQDGILNQDIQPLPIASGNTGTSNTVVFEITGGVTSPSFDLSHNLGNTNFNYSVYINTQLANINSEIIDNNTIRFYIDIDIPDTIKIVITY